MHAYLIFPTSSVPVPAGDLIRIGSSPECDLRVGGDSFVSRRHCSVSFVDDVLTVVDLNSTHGTFVNGTGVNSSAVRLQHDDVLKIGNTEITIGLQ